MRLLVTGACGFIGSAFVRWVLAEQPDVSVTNLDALTYAGNPDNLRDIADDARYRFVHGDIRDGSLLDDLVPGHDAIVNFAAETHVDRSIEGPAAFLDTNVSGAGVLFDAARRHGIASFLHISTDEVYGSIDVGSFREDDPLHPSSPYSASKAAADLLAHAYRETYDYPITVTRTTNNLGPYHYPEKVVPLFVTNLLSEGRLPLYGSGEHVRDWIHVEDNARAQWLVLTEGEAGTVYNVGAGNEISNRELALAIASRFGAGAEVIEEVPDRPGHDRRYSVDTSRIRALGFDPARTLDQALDDVVAWYRENDWWWRPLRNSGASRRRGLTTPSAGS